MGIPLPSGQFPTSDVDLFNTTVKIGNVVTIYQFTDLPFQVIYPIPGCTGITNL